MAEVVQSIAQCNFKKAIGEDWLDGEIFKDEKVGANLRAQVLKMLNTGQLPEYTKMNRVTPISKTNKAVVEIDQVRGIGISSHVTKVLEKAILNKLKQEES